jgi:hypothetical protein
MIERREFHPLQAEEIARAFNEKGVADPVSLARGKLRLGYFLSPRARRTSARSDSQCLNAALASRNVAECPGYHRRSRSPPS